MVSLFSTLILECCFLLSPLDSSYLVDFFYANSGIAQFFYANSGILHVC